MSEFIESSEQESPKGTETRESSVFEPPTYTISFNEDFTLNWEPAVGSMELAVALCYQFPLEKSLEDKMRAATKMFLKQNRKEDRTVLVGEETVAFDSNDQRPEDELPILSTTAMALPENSNDAAVDHPKNQAGMKIMKWNPELQGFTQKRSRRKLRDDEAVQVAANRGYACEDHKRRKLKCDPKRCLQNGQNVTSVIAKPTKGKIRNSSLPSSSIRESEKVIFEPTSSSDPNNISPNQYAANVAFKSDTSSLLDPMAPIFTPSSFPSSPFALSPLSSVASSANLNLLPQSGNYQFDFSIADTSSYPDANSFGATSYSSSVAAFDWQLPAGQQSTINLESFDFSSRTPDSSNNDTSGSPDENDASWDTWFNQLCDLPKDDMSLTPPESQRGNSMSLAGTPAPYPTTPPYTQTRGIQSCQTSSRHTLNDGIYRRPELLSRSGPQAHTVQTGRSYIQKYTFGTRSASRSPQPQQRSDDQSQSHPRSAYSSCRDLLNERATNYATLASEHRRASGLAESRIHTQRRAQHMSMPLRDDQSPRWASIHLSLGDCTKNTSQWRNVPAYQIPGADVHSLKVAQDLPWQDHEDILADGLGRMII